VSERSTASTNRQFRTSAKNRPATANTQTSAAPATVTNMRPVPGAPPRSVPEVGVGRLRSLWAGQELSGASRSSVTAAPLEDHCLHPSCRRASSVRRRAGAGGCRRTGRVSGPARAGPAVSPVRSRRPRRGRAAAGSAPRAGRVRASPVAAASPVRVRKSAPTPARRAPRLSGGGADPQVDELAVPELRHDAPPSYRLGAVDPHRPGHQIPGELLAREIQADVAAQARQDFP
jgi:hypothetical protein